MREKTAQYYMEGYNDAKAGNVKKKGFSSGMARRLYSSGFADAIKGLAPRR